MAIIKKSVVVQAPIEKVFTYLNDPLKLTEYWPGMVEVKDVEYLPNGGSCFNYVYNMAGIHIHGHSEDTEIIPLQKMVSISSGGMDATITWELENADGGTKVTITNNYTVPLPVIGKLAEALVVKMNEKEADTILAKMQLALEAPPQD